MIAHLLVLLIRAYQRTLSPLLGPVCRFSPSCSQYMLVCVERFGAARGFGLGMRRLARCHPFHPGGVDLPPEPPHQAGVAQSRHPGSISRPPEATGNAPPRISEQRP